MMDEWLRIRCQNCGSSIALPRTEQSFVLHCPLCGSGIEVNQLPTEGANGFCRFCYRTYDDHRWNMIQGSYEHTCVDRRG